jgi:flagellar biosynthesis/type III secretory pathway M-ring protein FliF/YscJ
MNILKLRLIAKKAWVKAKAYWWILVLGLGLLVGLLVWILSRNGAFIGALMELLESKRDAHDQELETLNHIHMAEVAEKNARLKEHHVRLTELEKEFENREEKLDAKKKAELKRLVDKSYNDPERLAREIAEAFGLKNG